MKCSRKRPLFFFISVNIYQRSVSYFFGLGFAFVSLFDDISTLVGLFNAQAILVEETVGVLLNP